MKRIFLSLMLCGSIAAVNAQDNSKFEAAMKKNIDLLDSAHAKMMTGDASLMETEANAFERIGNAEKDKWQPYYYAAYAQVMEAMFIKDKDKVDGLADKATVNVEKAEAFSPNNSELTCLRSLIAVSRISVDPMSRGAQYGMESATLLEKAKSQNPDNPRVYMMQGQNLYFTPAEFGGDKEKAKELFQLALQKFASFKPATSVDPAWGEAYTKKLLGTIK
jgi:hypothetical protein